MGRLLAMLQLFVQKGELMPSTHHSSNSNEWIPADKINNEPELITAPEWAERMARSFFQSNADYLDQLELKILNKINLTYISGSYENVMHRFKLDEHYNTVLYGASPSYLLNQAIQFLDYEPEKSGDPKYSFVTLIAIRLSNGTAKFKHADQLFKGANLSMDQPLIDLKKAVS